MMSVVEPVNIIYTITLLTNGTVNVNITCKSETYAKLADPDPTVTFLRPDPQLVIDLVCKCNGVSINTLAAGLFRHCTACTYFTAQSLIG